jgi:hypothetical protein
MKKPKLSKKRCSPLSDIYTPFDKTSVLTENTHSYVIHRDRAKEIGLHVSTDTADAELLNTMRTWLAEYAFESKVTHCIRYVLPKMGKQREGKDEIADSKEREGKQARRQKKNGATA